MAAPGVFSRVDERPEPNRRAAAAGSRVAKRDGHGRPKAHSAFRTAAIATAAFRVVTRTHPEAGVIARRAPLVARKPAGRKGCTDTRITRLATTASIAATLIDSVALAGIRPVTQAPPEDGLGIRQPFGHPRPGHFCVRKVRLAIGPVEVAAKDGAGVSAVDALTHAAHQTVSGSDATVTASAKVDGSASTEDVSAATVVASFFIEGRPGGVITSIQLGPARPVVATRKRGTGF